MRTLRIRDGGLVGDWPRDGPAAASGAARQPRTHRTATAGIGSAKRPPNALAGFSQNRDQAVKI